MVGSMIIFYFFEFKNDKRRDNHCSWLIGINSEPVEYIKICIDGI